MSYTFQQENQAWADTGDGDAKQPEVTDERGEVVADPTAQSGTVDTTDTSGETQSAADVSAVFDAADQANAANPAPEGTIGAPAIDPAATGEDALVPDYSDEAREEAERRNAANGGQTTDTTGDGVAPVAGLDDAVAAQGAKADEPADEDKFDGRKDPGDFTVPQVKKYLDGATDEQIKKVQAKEAKGQNRKGIMEYSKSE